ncbi:MAG: DUF4419 domain-containing protein [Bacteroidales bacterium]
MKQLLIITLILVCGSCKGPLKKEILVDRDSIPSNVYENALDDSKIIRFGVHVVDKAKSPLQDESIEKVLERRVGRKLMYFPDEQRQLQVVAFSGNNFLATVQECFDHHRPLVLSPDIIWLAICQGVSIHVNQHFDSLKNVLFRSEKKVDLVVRNDSLEFGGKHWQRLISDFSALTRGYTREDYYDFFVPTFSTTGMVEHTALEITMLEAMKEEFVYIGEGGCGIPYISLKGTRDDWEDILTRLEKLNSMGLDHWSKELEAVIKSFIHVYDNQIDLGFWRDIFKSAEDYDGLYISGWILKFFPYLKAKENEGVYDQTAQAARYEIGYIPNPFILAEDYLRSTVIINDIPPGIAEIEVQWHNYFKDEKKKMEVTSGFYGAIQYTDLSLEPLISFTITDKSRPAISLKYLDFKQEELPHQHEYWYPFALNNVTQKAIFNRKLFKTHENSMKFVSQVLHDSLTAYCQIYNTQPVKTAIEFSVSFRGWVYDIIIKNQGDTTGFNSFLRNQLSKMPGDWTPALMKAGQFAELYMNPTDSAKLVSVNSRLKLELFMGKAK